MCRTVACARYINTHVNGRNRFSADLINFLFLLYNSIDFDSSLKHYMEFSRKKNALFFLSLRCSNNLYLRLFPFCLGSLNDFTLKFLHIKTKRGKNEMQSLDSLWIFKFQWKSRQLKMIFANSSDYKSITMNFDC